MSNIHHHWHTALPFLLVGLMASAVAQPAAQSSPPTPEDQATAVRAHVEFCERWKAARTPAERRALMQRMQDTEGMQGPHGMVPSERAGMRSGMMGRGPRLRMRDVDCSDVAEATGAPVPQRYGNVVYVSGGIGQDDVLAMRKIAGDYNLHLTFTGKAGEYLSDVDTRIRRADGTVILGLVSDGPLLFVRLPAGRYQVSATYNGVERRIAVNVPDRGGISRSMAWPQ